MKKLLRINLDEMDYRLEEMPSGYANLGGRALSSQIINEEVPPKVDPLGPKNKLIFAAGTVSYTHLTLPTILLV